MTISIDLKSCRVFRDGNEIHLRRQLFRLLRFFIERPDQLLSKDVLAKSVWPGKITSHATIKVSVQKLREALGHKANGSPLIATRRGIGYIYSGEIVILPDPDLERKIDHSWNLCPSLTVLTEATSDDCTGLEADLMANLSSFSTLKVVAAASHHEFDRRLSTIRAISHELGVEYLVITAPAKTPPGRGPIVQAIDCASGHLIFAETLQTGQRDSSRETLGGLVARLEAQVIAHGNSTNPLKDQLSARDYLIIGNGTAITCHASNKRARDAFKLSLTMCDRNPEAWAGLAKSYIIDAFLQFDSNYENSVDLAFQCAEKAVSQGPSSSKAAWTMARAFHLTREWQLAEVQFDTAIALNPFDPDAHTMKGNFLAHCGRQEEAVNALSTAVGLVPLSQATAFWSLGCAHYDLKEYDQALLNLNRCIALKPNFSRPYRLVAAAHAKNGQIDKAQEIFQRKLSHDDTNNLKTAETHMQRTTRFQKEVDGLIEGFRMAGFPG